jgi:dolichol-phosphate mannosyltransferase
MRTSIDQNRQEVEGALAASGSIGAPSAAEKPLVVIPTYNERENLQAVVLAIREHLPQASMLIVDDASPDGTGIIADELAALYEGIHVLHRPGKMGLGTAYIEGFRFALRHDYTSVFEMDADFSHDPKYLPELLAAADRYDVVIGSRYVVGGKTPDWRLIRKLISSSGNVFARNVLSLPIRDCTAGFKCYRREVIAALDLQRINLQGYAFQIETVYQAYRAGFRIGEVPIVFPDRRLGRSKMSRQIVAEAFTYVVRRRMEELKKP